MSLYFNIAASALISFVWFIYLRRLDVFKNEKWGKLILAFALGCGTPYLVISADAHFGDVIERGETDLDHFLYQVLSVGLVEETCKILPFIFIYYLFKAVEESVDYIIYASLLALGFAAVENVMYFESYGSDIIQMRSLFSTFGHMIDTSICVYGIVYARYRKNFHPLLGILMFLPIGALTHGTFNFILEVDIPAKIFVMFGYFLMLLEVWALIINNCLNNSPHFDKKIVIDDKSLSTFLWRSFAAIILVQFVAVMAIDGFAVSLVTGILTFALLSIIFITISMRLTSFKLIQNRWYKVYPKLPFAIGGNRNASFTMGNSPVKFRIRGVEPNEHIVSKNLFEEVLLVPVSKHRSITEPVKGILEDKIHLYNDEVFYVFRSDLPVTEGNFERNIILLRAKDGENLVGKKYAIVAMLAVPTGADYLHPEGKGKNFPFIQWMYIVPVKKTENDNIPEWKKLFK